MSVATAYCTLADMQRLFSTQGVTAFADHDGDGEADSLNGSTVTGDCIDQATEEINFYLLRWYSAAQLATSTLVNRWCTVLAVYFLCQRRGNPDPEIFQAEFERIMAKLELVKPGGFTIPGLPFKSDLRPSFSNMEVDRRFPANRVRVQTANSDNISTTLAQNAANVIPVDTP